MIKLLYSVVLLTMTGTAQAEQFMQVWQSPDGGVKQYFDKDSVVRHGDLIEIWRIFEYKAASAPKVGRKPYVSQRVLTEFDCESMALRQLYASWHTETAGKGETVYEATEPELWEFGNNTEVIAPLWKIACGRSTNQ